MKKYVLVLDDNPKILDKIRRALSKQDFSVIAYSDPDDALEYFRLSNIEYDLIITDIEMPIMNGVEATKEITKEYPDVKILILTTFLDDEYIYEAIREGAVGYLLKDSPPEKIIEAISIINDGGSLMSPTVTNRLLNKIKSNDYGNEINLDKNRQDAAV